MLFDGRLGGPAHLPNSLGRLVAHPAVRVGELFDQDGQRLGRVDEPQRLAGTLDLMRIAAVGEFDQIGHHRLGLGARRQFLRRPATDDRRPVAEGGDQFRRGQTAPIEIETPGRHGCRGFRLVEPTRRIRIAAGDDEFPQWQRVGQHIGGGGTQSVVTTVSIVGIVIRLPGSVLFAAVIGERSVRAADQIKVPRGLRKNAAAASGPPTAAPRALHR